MEYESKWEDPLSDERPEELRRQKGFRQAEDVDAYMKEYVKKSVKPKQEIDSFMQWDKAREGY